MYSEDNICTGPASCSAPKPRPNGSQRMPAPAVLEDAREEPPPSGVGCAKAPSRCQGWCRPCRTLLTRWSLGLRGSLSSGQTQRSANSSLASPKSWTFPTNFLELGSGLSLRPKNEQKSRLRWEPEKSISQGRRRTLQSGVPKISGVPGPSTNPITRSLSGSCVCVQSPACLDPITADISPKSATNTPREAFRSFSPFAGYARVNAPRAGSLAANDGGQSN